jgi:Mg-chelatase subunit ChlI
MPRYFFHVRGADGEISRDIEGQDLPDLDAAKAEAVNSHREMLSEHLLHGGSRSQCEIAIAGQDGDVLAVVTAKDVLLHRGRVRDFRDDITKSAHTAPSRQAEKKVGEQQEQDYRAREAANSVSTSSATEKLAEEQK